jgi:hypothetical protein
VTPPRGDLLFSSPWRGRSTLAKRRSGGVTASLEAQCSVLHVTPIARSRLSPSGAVRGPSGERGCGTAVPLTYLQGRRMSRQPFLGRQTSAARAGASSPSPLIWRWTMRSALLATIAASTVSLALMTSADAASKHHRHHGYVGAAPYAYSGHAWEPAYRPSPSGSPGGCVTDEGGGRLAPCDYGGGRR